MLNPIEGETELTLAVTQECRGAVIEGVEVTRPGFVVGRAEMPNQPPSQLRTKLDGIGLSLFWHPQQEWAVVIRCSRSIGPAYEERLDEVYAAFTALCAVERLPRDWIYCFELVGPGLLRHVLDYPEPALYLIAVLDSSARPQPDVVLVEVSASAGLALTPPYRTESPSLEALTEGSAAWVNDAIIVHANSIWGLVRAALYPPVNKRVTWAELLPVVRSLRRQDCSVEAEFRAHCSPLLALALRAEAQLEAVRRQLEEQALGVAALPDPKAQAIAARKLPLKRLLMLLKKFKITPEQLVLRDDTALAVQKFLDLPS